MNNVAPVILTAMNVEVSFGEYKILDKVSLSVHQGDRIGLVGRNGSGKSTFLKIVSGVLAPDEGEIHKKKGLVIGFLSQEFTLDEENTVLENVIKGAANIKQMIEEYEKLPFDSPQKIILEERINHIDGWHLDKRASDLIDEVHAPEKDKIVANLSGGEKRRVALCRALISNPDLLILDEPTNHLDTYSIEWIENFLNTYDGTLIFVTHDRYFLDRIATRIVELNNGNFYAHQGNYTEYLMNKSERQAIAEAEEKSRQNFLRRELQWILRGPRARRTKAKARIDNYYEVLANENKEEELNVDLIIPEPEKLGNKVLNLKKLAYKIKDRYLFNDLTFAFQKGRKLGVVGRNGAGKTTLLKLILGDLIPFEGELDYGEKTTFNYIDQNRLILNDDDTVIASIGEGNETIKFGNKTITVWTYLRRFLFSDDRINTLVGRLSGGEKSRLTLAKILKNGGNFLLLDEPTNDLDLPTLRILEEALSRFNGVVVIVSHDRYFLNRICNGILALEEDGNTYFYEGNYDNYLEKKNKKLNSETPGIKIKKEDTRIKSNVRKLTYKETKELEGIEEEIMKAEEEIKRIEFLFSAPDFYEKYSEQISKLNSDLENLKMKVPKLYERWEELENIRTQTGN